MNAEGEIVRITPEVECNARPFCHAGGDTIAPGAEGPVEIYDAGCAGEPFELLLDGTGSRDPDGSPLTYRWAHSCPGSFLTGADTATPTLTTAIGIPTPCTVGLVVFDGVHESGCIAQIRVGMPPGLANIVLDAADEQVECDDADNAPELSAWLNSQGGAIAFTSDIVPLDWTNDFSPPLLPTAGGCGGEKSVDVTFKANVCNPDNSDETTATFATIDTTRPAFEDCPGNVIISCTDSISPTSTGTATG